MQRVQHSLQTLGPHGFQDLAAALMVAEFGARLRPLGAGPDGGRDMVYEGRLDWTGRSRGEDGGSVFQAAPKPVAPIGQPDVWSGYTVFQVKHHAPLDAKPTANATWLWTRIREELEAWTKPKPARKRTPDHLVFVTNVPLTAEPEHGGVALLEKRLSKYRANLEDNKRDLGSGSERLAQLSRLNHIKHVCVIEANLVDTLVSVHAAVRRAFSALLTTGDVFASLGELIGVMDEHQLGETLMRHARTTLTSDRGLSFDEAGGPTGSHVHIDRVAVDLPILTAAGDEKTVLRYVLDRGDRVLRPRTTLHQGPRHLVVSGPMGNGKTTISKLLVEAYRASLLKGNIDLGESATAAVSGIESRLQQLGCDGLPRHRRWPLRVDLAAFAEDEGQTETTLLRYIASSISRRTTRTVNAAHVDTWMRRWPWFLVLDGLDEVTEPRTRRSVIGRVMDLVDDADNDNLDMLVVLTTRPVGYTEDIAPLLFERVDLAPLPIDQALAYGKNVARARLGADHEAIARVERGLARAAAAENTRELMVTPLQVLILTIIIEAAGPLPPDRFALFWGYYDTVSKRERVKPGSLKEILDAHLPNITILHERLGYELHLRAQLSEHATATMTGEELRDVVAGVLTDDGHDPDGADADLVEDIRKACLQRLLLIRAHHDGVGFDVRALQELMAGRHLTTGPDVLVETRLRKLAAHPHWRVPWIFAAGRVFSESQPHRRDQVVEIVRNVDESAAWRLGRVSPVGPGLALDLAVDGGARRHPKVRKPLLEHALCLFDGPEPKDRVAVARLLLRAAGASHEARAQVGTALRKALGGSPAVREFAARLQAIIPHAANEVSASEDVRMLAQVRSAGPTGRRELPDPEVWWQGLRTLATQQRNVGVPGGDEAFNAVEGIHALRVAFTTGAASIPQWEQSATSAGLVGTGSNEAHFELDVRGPVLIALSHPQAAALLEEHLLDLPFQDPGTAIRLRDWVIAVRASVAWERDNLDACLCGRGTQPRA